MNRLAPASSLAVLVLASLPLTLACGDKDGDSGIEVAPVSFDDEVQVVFSRNCAASGCHAKPVSEGLDLSEGVSYDNIVGVASSQVPGMQRVVPGSPDDSYLVHKLAGTHESVGGTGDSMPPGLGLADTDIELVRRWVQEGAAR